MPWIDTTEYNPSDICPICQEEFGTTKAIYKTACNHKFHNDCLSDYCETHDGNVTCPVCRSDIPYSCMDVWAFKEHVLGSSTGEPLFNGNQHILDVYNRHQLPAQGGRKRKRTKRYRRSKKSNKSKKSKKSRKH